MPSTTGKTPRVSRIGMDVARPNRRRPRRLVATLGLLGLALAIYGVTRSLDRVPTVSRDQLLLATVERDDLVLEVRGAGILVPESERTVSNFTPGRVESIHFEPGGEVRANDVLIVLANPDVELQVLQAKRDWTEARARLLSAERNLQNERLSIESNVLRMKADHLEGSRLASTTAGLSRAGLVARHEEESAREGEKVLARQVDLEERRLALLDESSERELDLLREEVDHLEAIYHFRVGQSAAMEIRAGSDGIVQNSFFEVGQWVPSGTALATVSDPEDLKAVLRVPQTHAANVHAGLKAMIDTRSGAVRGIVRRVDPTIVDGQLSVEVELLDAPPSGARPNTRVDGSISIDRLDRVLQVERPASISGAQRRAVYRCAANSRIVERVTVTFGKSSLDRVEILDGLQEGNAVVLSDMSSFQDCPRIRIE